MKSSNTSQAAKELGRLGGQKTAKRGKEYFSLIGKRGAAKRWKSKKGGFETPKRRLKKEPLKNI